MEKRLLVAIALSVVILLLFSPKQQKPQDDKKQGLKSQDLTVAKNENTQAITKKEEKSGVVNERVETKEKPAAEVKIIPEELFPLINENLAAKITNIGGSFAEILLNNFKKELKLDKRVNLIQTRFPLWNFRVDGKEIGTIQFKRGEKTSKKISLKSDIDGDLSIESNFSINEDYLTTNLLKLKNNSDRISGVSSFVYFTFNLEEELKEKSSLFKTGNPVNNFTLHTLTNKIINSELKKIKVGEGKTIEDAFNWVGVGDKYFLNGIITRKPTPTKFEYKRLDENIVEFKIHFEERSVPPNGTIEYEVDLYTGPKDIKLLSKCGLDFEKTIDLGKWLGSIARPILLLLKGIYSYIPNYGIAIIILTLLVKLVLYPLNQKQFKSMKAMQFLQPQMAELRQKYKDDKQRLNIEMMNLFKRNRVNPMGGCLPMVLQMPVFFALYRVLYNSVELRHAPFFLWLNDLSVPDPYYISPILMGVMMYIQQSMTPMTGDPAQVKMMKMMPIVFSLFMLALPSGLVVYILTNSLLSILQQWQMTRK